MHRVLPEKAIGRSGLAAWFRPCLSSLSGGIWAAVPAGFGTICI